MSADTEVVRQPPDPSHPRYELLGRLERRLRDLRDGSAFVLMPPATDVAPVGPIVCVVDTSRAARHAARLAGALAAEVDAALVLAQAVSVSELDDDHDGRMVEARARLATRHRVAANVRRVLGDRRIELVRGGLDTRRMLVRFARARDARLLIVVGSSLPWTDLSPAVLCPVVVIPASVGGGCHMPC